MIPSDRINELLKQLGSQGPFATDPLLKVAQALATTLDEEQTRRLAVEGRMLEILLQVLLRTGWDVDPRWIQDLQDMRGKTRLVSPQGDQILIELMQLVVGTLQDNALRAAEKQAAQQQGDPHAKPQQN